LTHIAQGRQNAKAGSACGFQAINCTGNDKIKWQTIIHKITD